MRNKGKNCQRNHQRWASGDSVWNWEWGCKPGSVKSIGAASANTYIFLSFQILSRPGEIRANRSDAWNINYRECTYVCARKKNNLVSDSKIKTSKKIAFTKCAFSYKITIVAFWKMWPSVYIHFCVTHEIPTRRCGCILSRVKEDMLGCLLERKESLPHHQKYNQKTKCSTCQTNYMFPLYWSSSETACVVHLWIGLSQKRQSDTICVQTVARYCRDSWSLFSNTARDGGETSKDRGALMEGKKDGDQLCWPPVTLQRRHRTAANTYTQSDECSAYVQ